MTTKLQVEPVCTIAAKIVRDRNVSQQSLGGMLRRTGYARLVHVLRRKNDDKLKNCSRKQ